MKINLSPDELMDFAQNGKLTPEMRTRMAGTILEILMSEESITAAMKVVQDKAEAVAKDAIAAAVFVEKESRSNKVILKGYLAQEITTKIKEELGNKTVSCLVDESLKAMVNEPLERLIAYHADRAIGQRLDDIARGNLNKYFLDRVTDDYLNEFIERCINKKLSK